MTYVKRLDIWHFNASILLEQIEELWVGGANNFVVKKGRTNDKNVTRIFHWKISNINFYLLLMSVSFTHVLCWQRKVQIIYDQHLKFHNLNRSYWFFKFQSIRTINEGNQILISSQLLHTCISYCFKNVTKIMVPSLR